MLAFYLAASLLIGTDTIYTPSQKIPCTVKEVSDEQVRFVYPGEEVVNLLTTAKINKIVFASGRVQVFPAPLVVQPLTSPLDWQHVILTQLEGEIKGLVRVGEVSATAKGATVYSGTQKVRSRAETKIKMQAAMMGASVIYLMQEGVNGHQAAGTFSAGHNAETSISGVAYAAHLPTMEEFTAKVGTKKSLT